MACFFMTNPTTMLTGFDLTMDISSSPLIVDCADEIMDLIKVEHECDSTERRLFTFDPVPSLEDYPGAYDFSITLNQPQQGKSSSFYSKILKQVFIDMNKVLLINFGLNSAASGLYVRALPVYSAPEFSSIPVNRCTVHAIESDPSGSAHMNGICRCSHFDNVGHIIRTQSKDAQYCYDNLSGRHSVLVPVKKLQPGSQTFAIAYYFACKTSCPRGMQRRPINIVFTLENVFGDVLGRKILGLRICSCPKRDKERLERDFNKGKLTFEDSTSKRMHVAGTKRKACSTCTVIEKMNNEINDLTKIMAETEKRIHSLIACIDTIKP